MELPAELIFLVEEKRKFKINDKIISTAIEKGDIHLLKSAAQSDFNLFTFHYFTTAVRCNQLAIVQWMFPQIDEGVIGGIHAAARWGHLDLVKWLHGQLHSCEYCSEWAIDSAAEYGHLHVLEWFDKNCDARGSTRAMDWAAAKGQIAVLEWLKVHYYGCSEWASELARRFEQSDAIQWLRDNGVYVD